MQDAPYRVMVIANWSNSFREETLCAIVERQRYLERNAVSPSDKTILLLQATDTMLILTASFVPVKRVMIRKQSELPVTHSHGID